MAEEDELLKKFKKIMEISNRIKQSQAAEMMGITQTQLTQKLFEWGEKLSFKIEDDSIVVENMDSFMGELDGLFEEWGEKEITKAGKAETIPMQDLPQIPKEKAPSSAETPEISSHQESENKEISDIEPEQLGVIRQFEELLGGKKIPLVDHVSGQTIGYSLDNNMNIIKIKIKNKELAEIPDSIGKLSHLEDLNLSSNTLRGLPDTIGELETLRTLNIEENKIKALPDSIENLIALKSLYAGRNQLETLPETIGNLKNLIYLDLQNNSLHSIPDSIGNLSRLEKLWIRRNLLEEIPKSIGDLTKLEKLWLNNNRLEKIPKQIGYMTNLEKLYLGNNNLTKLPRKLKKLQKLKTLKCKKNPITKIPSWAKKIEKRGGYIKF